MIKTIVIAYDESDVSRRALERAAALSRAFESTLIVTTVAPVDTPAAPRSLGTDPTDTAEEHRVALAAARGQLESEGVSAEYIEAFGHPAEAILTVASERSADLIVTGSREIGILQRMLGQSVSDAVSHGARCDVLIVH